MLVASSPLRIAKAEIDAVIVGCRRYSPAYLSHSNGGGRNNGSRHADRLLGDHCCTTKWDATLLYEAR